jgi:LacI family transcriptional regulator
LLRQHKVTIKGIAAMCGVSTQTVSRVINRRPDVAPETRRAVEAAIAAVGFQPSAVARSLVQRRSLTLGVIMSGLGYFGVSQTLNGIAEACEESEYALLLKELPFFETPDSVPLIEALISHRVEGIIYAVPQVGDNVRHVQAQLPASCPAIVFLKCEPSPDFTTIAVDNYAGGREATEHLIRLGRRRIAHVAGPSDWLEARQREQAWLDAVRDAGLAPGPCARGTWFSASGVEAFAEVLAQGPAPDAVFAANDQMALGVLRVAHARGLRVPEDLAVVGFDNVADAGQYMPALTTVDQPLPELGRVAVRELLALVEADVHGDQHGSGNGRSVSLPAELVVRESAPAIRAPGVTAPGVVAAGVATPGFPAAGVATPGLTRPRPPGAPSPA